MNTSAAKRLGRLRILLSSGGGLMLLATSAFLLFGLALWAQTSESQSSDANQSWTTTRESRTDFDSAHTVESHVRNGNRTVDKQTTERRGPDGNVSLYQSIEKESVQVNANTVRTTTRTYGRDGSGAKALVQVTEEETQTLPGGGSKTVRTTSNPDLSGKLQPVQREVAETKKISGDVEVTKTTVMLPSVNGGLSPASQIEERRQHVGNNTEFKKTTSMLDGGGNWQVSEVRQGTIKDEGKNRSTEERVSRPDVDGKLGEVARTVKKETENPSGEKRNTVENYSVDVPGSTRDGNLHIVQRETTKQSVSSGQQTSVQQVEQPNAGDPGAGLRVVTITSSAVRTGPSGAQGTQTIQVRNGSGSFDVVSVDTSKSDNTHAVQVQIAPTDQPKAAPEKTKAAPDKRQAAPDKH